jgi:pilus assembly protein CpaF
MAYPPAVQRIAPLLDDPSITEVMINGVRQTFVERAGRMEEIPSPFTDKGQLEALIDALVLPTGRSVTTRSPFVDFRMKDGSRVNVVIAPVALDGPVITIRKFTRALGSMADLVRVGTITERLAYFFFAAIRGRLNVVFSGGTGTGKTTTLGLASAYIPETERIVVIEDTAELDLRQRHVVRLECRPPNLEGAGAITMAELLRNSLRMRPTRLIVGEIRGDEAIEMLQAMTSGHDGCLAVLHASSPAHAMSRLEMMMLGRGLPLPLWGIQRQIADAIDVVVQLALFPDGSRRVTHVTEVAGRSDDGLLLRDLYRFVDEGFDEAGRLVGRFECTGERPSFLPKLRHVDPDVVKELFVAGPG